MKRMKERFPDIPLWFSYRTMFLVTILFYLGALPFFPIVEDCFNVPYYTDELNYIVDRIASDSFSGKCFKWFM